MSGFALFGLITTLQCKVVGVEGLEPPCLATIGPKPIVYTNFTTRPKMVTMKVINEARTMGIFGLRIKSK